MVGARAVRAEGDVNKIVRLGFAGDICSVVCKYLIDDPRVILPEIIGKPVCETDDRTGMNTAFLAVDLGTGSTEAIAVGICR